MEGRGKSALFCASTHDRSTATLLLRCLREVRDAPVSCLFCNLHAQDLAISISALFSLSVMKDDINVASVGSAPSAAPAARKFTTG